jgi:hypothetical protein
VSQRAMLCVCLSREPAEPAVVASRRRHRCHAQGHHAGPRVRQQDRAVLGEHREPGARAAAEGAVTPAVHGLPARGGVVGRGGGLAGEQCSGVWVWWGGRQGNGVAMKVAAVATRQEAGYRFASQLTTSAVPLYCECSCSRPVPPCPVPSLPWQYDGLMAARVQEAEACGEVLRYVGSFDAESGVCQVRVWRRRWYVCVCVCVYVCVPSGCRSPAVAPWVAWQKHNVDFFTVV